jgi:hypothetical protein
MAGLDPAIHDFLSAPLSRGCRVKPGHDDSGTIESENRPLNLARPPAFALKIQARHAISREVQAPTMRATVGPAMTMKTATAMAAIFSPWVQRFQSACKSRIASALEKAASRNALGHGQGRCPEDASGVALQWLTERSRWVVAWQVSHKALGVIVPFPAPPVDVSDRRSACSGMPQRCGVRGVSTLCCTSHASPASVPACGRYSQPIQPR